MTITVALGTSNPTSTTEVAMSTCTRFSSKCLHDLIFLVVFETAVEEHRVPRLKDFFEILKFLFHGFHTGGSVLCFETGINDVGLTPF